MKALNAYVYVKCKANKCYYHFKYLSSIFKNVCTDADLQKNVDKDLRIWATFCHVLCNGSKDLLREL